MSDMFTHEDSYGDKLNIWFTHAGGLLVATGNGPSDGDIIEMEPSAVVNLVLFLNNGIELAIEQAVEERDYNYMCCSMCEEEQEVVQEQLELEFHRFERRGSDGWN